MAKPDKDLATNREATDFSVEKSASDATEQFTVDTNIRDELNEKTVDLAKPVHREESTQIAESAVGGDTIAHTPEPQAPASHFDRGKGEVPTSIEIDETTPPPDVGGATLASVGSKQGRRNLESLVGKTIGDYRIDSQLGRGGMGIVYKAHHTKLRRDVAIKMILGAAASDKAALERFETEARAIANLNHANVVQLFEVGQYQGSPFIVLEFVDGGTLVQKTKEAPLAPTEAAKVVEQLALAMHAAHEQGILHRDLKPANILLDTAGTPKITDFGLAKEVLDANQSETKTGTVMGTPSFMSPEQAKGLISELSGATDQYSLGAVLYAIVSGRPPFMSSTTVETITQVVHKDPIPLRQLAASIPADLETICLKSLQKEPEKRYADCRELAADLRRFIEGEPIKARPISAIQRAARWCKRNPRIAVPSGVAALFFVATALISSWAWATTSAQAAVIAQERDEAQTQRDEARKQRVLALEAQAQAEKNQELAESQALLALKNIQLIVSDIDGKLEAEPGMSELRIGILELLEDKWNELDVALAGGIHGQAIPTLMAVRFKIAAAWVSLGNPQKANEIYTKLYETGKDRVIVKNRSDASRTNLALICTTWASVKESVTGDPADAAELQDEAIKLFTDVVMNPVPLQAGEKPGHPKYQIAINLQKALFQRANDQKQFGQLEKLEATLGEVEEISNELLNDYKEDAEWIAKLEPAMAENVRRYFVQNTDLARGGRAAVLCSLGQSDEAFKLYDEIIEVRRKDIVQAPEDANAKDQLARQLASYGKNLLKLGHIDKGAKILAESNQIIATLFELDPTDANTKLSYGASLHYLGTAREAQGLKDDATALYERARVHRKDLYEKGKDKSSKVNLMLSNARLGNMEATQELISDLEESDAVDPDLRLDLARSWSLLSKFAKDEATRDKYSQNAISELRNCIEAGHSDPYPIEKELDFIPINEKDGFKAVVMDLRSKRAEARELAKN